MSIERQPGRPSEQEFVAAATRIINDKYETRYELMVMQNGYFSAKLSPELQRSNDLELAQQEYDADGRVPGCSLMDFVFYQLGVYAQNMKK